MSNQKSLVHFASLRPSVGCFFLVVLLLGVLQSALAQDISNIRVHLDAGQKQVVISYDLTGTGPLAGDLILQMSNDQGKTWSVAPRSGSVSGDVGKEVQSGLGKKIVWQAGEDFYGLVPDDFMARLSVEKLVSSASSGQSAPEAQPTISPVEQDQENKAEMEAIKSLPQTISGKDAAIRILIPTGYFMMGSPAGKGEKNEYPQHRVWISSFYMDQKLVTFDQYDKFCDATKREKPIDGFIQYKQQPHWGRGQRPVLSITWKEADAYCKWAGGRLPTEAEWEKAARGGSDTAYFWGNDAGKAEDYACFGDNSSSRTFPVGQFKPNGYGLYDIVGELWEWVSDWYEPQYYSESPERNPTGPDTGKLKVLRGGSFANGSDCLTVTRRNGWDLEKQDGFVEFVGHVYEHGCRCVQTP